MQLIAVTGCILASCYFYNACPRQRNATIDAGKISVDVIGSKVVLRGSVRSFAEREDAEYAAWASAGVTNVENKLTITEPALVF